MRLLSLSQETDIELMVSAAGSVVLLHKGPLARVYDWAQYDSEQRAVYLVTQDGDIQDLGLTIFDPVANRLHNTREVIIICINEKNEPEEPVFLKFTGMAG
ncbi:MAG: hypothetical protein KDI13_06245 [Alphaproteobacteria bacterium]|nr:hypothetical protein [Alphaproteobacteria bacterium]